MRNLGLYIFICIVCPCSLSAQKRATNRVVPYSPSFIVPLKHNYWDSIHHVSPQIKYASKRLKDQHIENPAVRYAIENLKKEQAKYYEINKAINTLTEYAENKHIKYLINYIRTYLESISEKEDAIEQIQARISEDSINFYKQHPEMDTIHYDIFLNTDLSTLVTFMKQDRNYQWLKEKSRDSVLITLLSASNCPQKLWLNNGKIQYHRFVTQNLLGDTIGTVIKVLPRGNRIKFVFDENVYQIKKNITSREIPEAYLLKAPDSIYFALAKMNIGSLKRKYWTYCSDVILSFGQGYITKNWSSGGENSLSILADLKYFLNYKKENLGWENSFRYRLGALKSGNENLSKNEDKIEIQSKVGIKAFRHWNYATQFDMNTALFKTYNYPKRDEVIASFLTPGNFTLSLGLDYKPKSNISLYLSPIAGQWIYVRDTNRIDPSRFGLEEGKKFKGDAGAKVELKNNHELFKFLKVDNHLILFSSYYEQPERLTVDWRLSLDFKINYFMQTSVYANAVYDQTYSKKIQLKQTLNIGVHFRF